MDAPSSTHAAPAAGLSLRRAAPPPSPVPLAAVAALLEGLDAQQRAAVTHGEGPLLVLAGPGTGKTRVITRRIAWLIATRRAHSSEILALTFTDKAAEEMQARVDVLVPYGYADSAILTFHAFGDRLLREFAFELGLPTDLRVLSRAEAVVFVRERLFRLGLERYRPLGDPTRFLGALVELFSRAKDEDVDPRKYAAFADGLASLALDARESGAAAAVVAELLDRAGRQGELARAYERYQTLLAEAGCVDFGDQLALALRLLREHASVRAELRRRFRYILVDEFQDTNPAQLALLELLAGEERNVTVVGDDDQAVYTFRGAALGNILDFRARFHGAREVVLRRNYRSRRPVLDAAHRLIVHNDPERLGSRDGLDKRLIAHRRPRRAEPVEHRVFETQGEEADWVAATIAERIRDGAHPRDFAILVRGNADADPFLRSLNLNGVPWRFSGAAGLYARPEVRELRAFLRVVADIDSSVDLYGVATGEPYRLGGIDLTKMLEYAGRRHRSLWSTCSELVRQPGLLRLEPGTRDALASLVGDLEAASELAHRRSAGEVLYDHLKRSGRLARLTAGGPEREDALLNVARFFELVRSRSRLLPDDRVPFLVRHLETLVEAGDDPATATLGDEDAVAVLTVHKAKGLEFPVVFLVGLVDGRFPARGRADPLTLPDELRRDGSPSSGSQAALAEERRLCYVAMTRARDQLFLTSAARSATGRAWRVSPFVAEALDAPRSGARPAADHRTAGPLAPFAMAGEATPVGRRDASERRLTLSFSQLNDYLTCPLRFKLQHTLRVPVPAHHALVYGTALHQAVAAFHLRQMAGRPMSADELLEVFAAHWSSEGFLSREHEEARFAAGRETLLRFHAAQQAAAPPLAVEQEFAFVLDGDRVRGRFDRLDESPDGTVITDYKSGDVRDPATARKKARESLQLAMYALAEEARTGSPPAAVQLHFLDSGVVGRAELNRSRLDRAREKVRAAAEGIRQGDFEARPDQVACGFCPYRDICPASAA